MLSQSVARVLGVEVKDTIVTSKDATEGVVAVTFGCGSGASSSCIVHLMRLACFEPFHLLLLCHILTSIYISYLHKSIVASAFVTSFRLVVPLALVVYDGNCRNYR